MTTLPEGIFKQKAPCTDCPFRRVGGVRHSRRMMASYISYFLGSPGATFPCHKSVPKEDDRTTWSAWQDGQVLCAGGLIFAAKHGVQNAVVAAGLRSGAYVPSEHRETDAVYESVAEMLAASDDSQGSSHE